MTTHELTLPDGNRVTLNPVLVTCFQPCEEGTMVVFIGWRLRDGPGKL